MLPVSLHWGLLMVALILLHCLVPAWDRAVSSGLSTQWWQCRMPWVWSVQWLPVFPSTQLFTSIERQLMQYGHQLSPAADGPLSSISDPLRTCQKWHPCPKSFEMLLCFTWGTELWWDRHTITGSKFLMDKYTERGPKLSSWYKWLKSGSH